MKISENWLREWADPDLDSAALLSQLTMAGLEVDSVEPAAAAFDQVVVAEVLSCEKHPDADKLNLCMVNDGSPDSVQVICGAPNVRVGLKVAFAQVGAQLPGFKIKKAKLRGVESCGMICSEQELGMAESSDGILELPADASIGTGISDYLKLDDQLIEIDLTPNRGDCLSIAGVAREVAANNDIPLNSIKINKVETSIDDRFDVKLQNPQACPHYVGRVIKGVNVKAETPLWMKEKLRRSGLRPISPAVDVTNYVMMELGQPMHAFDLDKLSGGIIVRNAVEGEKIELLDGSELEMRDDTLVIADHEGAVALAGIMGGMGSSVQDDTTDILLEAAHFTPALIAGKARSYGLHTDSSHRFERGVDAQLQKSAMQRATELVVEIMGGSAGPILNHESIEHLPENPEIRLRHARIERLLGIQVSNEQVERILSDLNMDYTKHADDWTVKAPSYRFDINIEADLIEEVGRIIGYNNIPGTKESAHVTMESFSETQISENSLRDMLVSRGYYEAITYSFVSPELQDILDPGQQTLSLSNPISSDMSEMRTSLLPGLIQAVQHNLNRQQSRIRLFETGLCFIPEEHALEQKSHLAAIVSGSSLAENWGDPNAAVDFFDLKGDLQSLMMMVDINLFEFKPSSKPILHPGQSADIYLGEEKVGYIGSIHPSVLDRLDIDQKLLAFELNTECLLKTSLPEFTELSKFPTIRRDLALMVDLEIQASELIKTVKSTNSEILQDVFIFDVYTGKEVINNRKSVALGLILQDFSRTLTEQDVEKTVTEVLQILEKQHNAVLR